MKKQQGGKRNFPAGRLLAALLSLCLLIGLVPGAQTTAFADGTDKAIVPGVAGLNDPVFSNGYYHPSDYIYFGLYQGSPLKWRVLDADKAFDKQTDGVFLMTEELLEEMRFNQSGESTVWEGSNAQAWCRTFAGSTSNFSAVEQGVMMGIAKTEGEYDLFEMPWGECILSAQDKMFFISVQEYHDYVADRFNIPEVWEANNWWLRTPSLRFGGGTVASSYPGGGMGSLNVWADLSARPAFNLDSSAVLFSSPASGGKPDGEISAIGDYSGNEWKLTLKDSSRDGFTIENLHRAGNIITFYYSGAAAGANEYISALVVDSTGAYTHYGRLQPADEAAGTVVFTLPELPEGSTLYIFNEQCNGDYKTDYASHLVELTVPEDTSGAGADGREVELKNDGATIQWRYAGEDDSAWRDLVALDVITGADGTDGEDGREVELQVDYDSEFIQWRYITGSDTGWKNLLPLSVLEGEDGREVELKNDGDSILWRYEGEGDDAWQTLVALSSITGADGKEVQLQVADGYIQWKYDADSDWQNLIAVSALQGMKGDKGDQGEKGEKGDNGDTPTIGANGNWWISGVDTGVKASGGSASGSGSSSGSSAAGKDGQDGQDGASGVGIAELAINESGELVVTLTDGTEKNLGKITGEDGVGVAGVAINEKGELIVTLTDGTELNAGAIPAGAAAPGLEPLVYIALGAAVISLVGMIVMAAYLLAKRKSLLTQA